MIDRLYLYRVESPAAADHGPHDLVETLEAEK